MSAVTSTNVKALMTGGIRVSRPAQAAGVTKCATRRQDVPATMAAMATTTPIGYGHVFAPAHYIDAWIHVTDVKGWPPEEIARLKRHLAQP